jgi:hypothetical protein
MPTDMYGTAAVIHNQIRTTSASLAEEHGPGPQATGPLLVKADGVPATEQ